MAAVTVTRRALKEGLGTSAGVVINAVVAMAITWLVSRNLGATGAGYFFLLTSLFVITTSLIGMGADTGLMRTLSQQRAVGDVARYRTTLAAAVLPPLVAGAALSTALLLLAPDVAAVAGVPTDQEPAVRLLAVFLTPAALVGILLGGCRGLGAVHAYTAVQNLAVPLVRVAGIAIVLVAGGSVVPVLAAWAAPLGIAVIAAAALLWRYITLERMERGDRSAGSLVTAIAPFWRFAFPRGMAIMVERGIDWADVLLVIYLLGPGPGGVYGVVSRCAMAGQFLESALRIVAGPRISGALAINDRARLISLFGLVTRLSVLALWPFYLVLAMFADRILAVFGTEFTAGSSALMIVCAAMMCAAAAGMVQTVLLMGGRSHWQLGNRTVHLLVLLGIAWLLVPRFGLVGAGVAWACGIVTDTILAVLQVRSAIGVHVPFGTLIRVLGLPTLIFGLGGYFLRQLTHDSSLLLLVAGLVMLAACYAAAIYRFRNQLHLPTTLGGAR